MIALLWANWPYAIIITILGYLLATYLQHGLNKYPGPFLAKFTNLWRLLDVRRDHHHQTLFKLHRNYGSIVRTGPNTVSVASPDWIPRIYAINKGITKTNFYKAFRARSEGRAATTIFAVQDEETHSLMKRPISNMYSLSGLSSYEPLVDDTITLFMDRLQQEFGSGKACNMADWLQFYAFDVILNLTFSNTLGFLEQGKDVENFMHSLDLNQQATSLMGQMPWTVYLWKFNPVVARFAKDNNAFPAFVRQQIQEHIAKIREAKSDGGEQSPDHGMRDFLYRFLTINAEKPETMPMAHVFAACMANVIAGSDTTAITLRSITYYILKNPTIKAKLLQELRDADLSYPVTWKESQKLPYLDACIKEALRLHPAVGLGLERRLPKNGMAMPDGNVLPEGTQVSVNAWVVHRDETVFGPDAESFVPERWLQAKDERDQSYEDRLSYMKRTDMAFGWGKRICLGRNISLLEIYKAIPTMLLEFDIDLVNGDAEWTIANRWFVRQSNMDCYLKRRVR